MITSVLFDEILRYAALGAAIRGFWRAPERRAHPTWRAHEDINDVMLATALVPDGYLLSGAT